MQTNAEPNKSLAADWGSLVVQGTKVLETSQWHNEIDQTCLKSHIYSPTPENIVKTLSLDPSAQDSLLPTRSHI